MARPTKRSPEVEQKILNALRVGNTRTDAALVAGINRDTLHEWLAFPEFSAAVERAEAEARARAVGYLAKAAAGHWQAALAFLDRGAAETARAEIDEAMREHIEDMHGESIGAKRG
ncbi:MAG: hypothetical protein ABSB34_02015 [Candidatus Limnocylindrales bacterium]